MKILSIFITICLLWSTAPGQLPASTTLHKSNCYSDVLPLGLGNQWTYRYSWSFEDNLNPVVIYQSCDTGTVQLTIINSTSSTDSTIWRIQRLNNHWSQLNRGGFYGPHTNVDTVELIERHQDRHQVYISGEHNFIRGFVLPFFQNWEDSSSTYRYCMTDSAGNNTYDVFGPDMYWYKFTLQHGIGETSLWVSSTCMCGWTESGSYTLIESSVSSVESNINTSMPRTSQLVQNYPNPFNPSTTIQYEVRERSSVKLIIFDALGRYVTTLVDREQSPGWYTIPWNASSYSSGIYFYQLTVGEEIQTRKMLFIK